MNEEWNKTKNDAPFVTFYDMCAVTFALADEMADVSIAGLTTLKKASFENIVGKGENPGNQHVLFFL